jgi:hypothetical protein
LKTWICILMKNQATKMNSTRNTGIASQNQNLD